MRKKTAISILISSLLLVTPALAVDSTTSAISPKFIRPVNRLEQNRLITQQNNIERLEDRTARIASREANLKSALQAFKNKQKADIVQRINQFLNSINQNQTQLMQKHLDLMTSILDKLEKRITQGTPDIKNPQLAETAVANSRAAIASASAAVKAQMDKDYTISVTSETKVKTDVQKVRQQLYEDLQVVRKAVISAKQSVASAIRAAKSGDTSTTKEGTASGQQ